MVLLIDNYDSFTYNLVDYLSRNGANCHVIRNNEKSIKEIEKMNFKAIVISPGPGRPQESGITMEVIDHFYQKKPILGVCLGHQAIGEYFGAALVKADYPMHGKVSSVQHNNHWLFNGIPNPFNVMRYHSLLIKDVPLSIEITACTKQGEIMAIAHKKLPLTGLQFHPESVLTTHGLHIVRNWLNQV